MSSSTSSSTEKYLDLLNLLGELVASKADLNSILQSTVRLIQDLLQVQRCSILLLDAAGEYLTHGASSGIPESIQKQIRIRMGEGIAGQVASTGEPILSQEGEEDPSGADPSRYATHSFISVPILHQHRKLGVINVTEKTQRRGLGPADLQLLESVARFLGLATEKARLNVQTELLHEHLKRTMESLPIGVLTVHWDGRIITSNSTAGRLLGRIHHEKDVQRIHDCFPSATARAIASLVETAVCKKQPQEIEMEIQGADDQTIPVRLTARLVEPYRTGAMDVAILVEDLTLPREVQELRKLDELKSNFIAMVSHELRTPLTSIRGSGHLLTTYYSSHLDDTQRNLIRIIGDNTERLIGIVNNILDISLLDNNTLHLDLISVDLNERINSCLKSLSEQADQKNIRLEVDLCQNPLPVWGDPERLHQVLDQILDNSFKFTPPQGWIRVISSRESDQAVVDVTDSGEGIPVELREKVFEKFFQAENALTRRSGGTGLGLYLARALIELHGGVVSALETSGLGAHIRICLPLETSFNSLKNKERY